MNKELRTMEEKMKLDPNEMMENGKTRAENEEFEKNSAQFGGAVSIISIAVSLYCIIQVLSM
jgi:hypothetical protein